MIKNADYSSAGHYSCIANNNVDMQLKKKSLVVVRCKFFGKPKNVNYFKSYYFVTNFLF